MDYAIPKYYRRRHDQAHVHVHLMIPTICRVSLLLIGTRHGTTTNNVNRHSLSNSRTVICIKSK